MEAGFIDLGSQVIVIRKDLADEVAARINPGVRLEMKWATAPRTDFRLRGTLQYTSR